MDRSTKTYTLIYTLLLTSALRQIQMLPSLQYRLGNSIERGASSMACEVELGHSPEEGSGIFFTIYFRRHLKLG